MSTEPLLTTPIHDWHVAHGGRMVAFAGYHMPVQYELGVLKEHLHTRSAVGLFDVSHMGIAYLSAGDRRHETVASALESLVPADILNLRRGQQRYSQILNDDGGIIDDIMVWRPREPAQEGTLGLVVNGACKERDYAHLSAHLPNDSTLSRRDDWALFALQGPLAEAALSVHTTDAAGLTFMQVTNTSLGGVPAHISRSGYTGEDGFEIAVPAAQAVDIWSSFASDARVQPIGLGARDSLRLESGMCLYGHDIDATTSPVEANLTWSIQKRRREESRFPGAARIQRELRDGPARLRVGLQPTGRAPLRGGASLFETETSRDPIGVVTSGGFGPSFGGPVAMGYVAHRWSMEETRLFAELRGLRVAVLVRALPFVASRFKR